MTKEYRYDFHTNEMVTLECRNNSMTVWKEIKRTPMTFDEYYERRYPPKCSYCWGTEKSCSHSNGCDTWVDGKPIAQPREEVEEVREEVEEVKETNDALDLLPDWDEELGIDDDEIIF